MFKNNISKLVTLSVCILGGMVLFYSVYRAYNNSFTHDESYTYNHYVNNSVWSIITYEEGPDIPNNHILNTLLMKLFQFLFGSSEFALRLPNLLAHAAYLLFTILWLKKLNNNFILLISFIVLNLNPYLLDFFALARGYGLSVSFMFMSFYFFYEYIFSLKLKDNFFAFLFGTLSVWSNFSLLNYYVSLVIIFNIFQLNVFYKKEFSLLQKLKKVLINSLPGLIITIILASLIYQPLITIHANLFGPEDGFYRNTIRTLIVCTTQSDAFTSLISYFVILVLVCALIFFMYDSSISKFNLQQSPALLILLFAFITALSTIIQYALFGTQFLEKRTALFFIVLFNINFVYLIYYFLLKFGRKLFPVIIASIYSAFVVINFIVNFRPHYYADWKYDACTKEMLKALEENYNHSHSDKSSVTLGISWVFEPSINFYRNTKNLDWLGEVNRDGYNGTFDYYYVYDDRDFIYKNKKIIIKEFNDYKTILEKKSLTY